MRRLIGEHPIRESVINTHQGLVGEMNDRGNGSPGVPKKSPRLSSRPGPVNRASDTSTILRALGDNYGEEHPEQQQGTLGHLNDKMGMRFRTTIEICRIVCTIATGSVYLSTSI